MGIASLILSIISFLVSFPVLPVFKYLSLVLGILGVILGIIAIVKKTGKNFGIAGLVVSLIALVLLFTINGGSVFGPNSNKGNTNNNYKLNDEIKITNDDGEYTLTITGIKEIKDRNSFSELKPEQVFLIDYTYKNVSSKDDVYISDTHFKIIDEKGEFGNSYPITVSSSCYPKEISQGVTLKAQMVLCVNNPSNKVKLQYFDNMFNETPSAVIDLDVK